MSAYSHNTMATINKSKATPQPIRQKRSRWFLLPSILCLLIFATGCVKYDLGINFEGQYQGTFVQHVQLDEQLTSFSQDEALKWLHSLESRAKKLHGNTEHLSPRDIVISIPFSNSRELVAKFNQFFHPTAPQNPRLNQQAEDLVELESQIDIHQSNLLLVERNKLNLTLDLRALGGFSDQAEVIVDPNSLFDLEFSLNTPWGAKNISKPNNLIPKTELDSHRLLWTLQPGKLNHIEAVFWLPSYLGLGTVVIALLVIVSFYLKYRRFPWQAAVYNS